MKFKWHGTFYLRKGWLPKGMKQLKVQPTLFSDKNINPSDELGLGSNMVSALRNWLKYIGLTEEGYENGKKQQKFTELGDLIFEKDRYMEELGTLALLHYKLASCVDINEEGATSWIYFFNKFKMHEFTQDDFVRDLQSYIKMFDTDKITVAEESIASDYTCIINTYFGVMSDKVDPEDNKESPLVELGLIQLVDKKKKIYKKSSPAVPIPSLILAALIKFKHEEKEIKISSLLNDENNLGRIFNLDSVLLSDYLDKMEAEHIIKVVRTAGLDVIKFEEDKASMEYIKSYYKQLGK